METTLILGALFIASIAFLAGAIVRILRVSVPPDEWLLHVRDGQLIQAGIGINIWRRPGDSIARFSSTMQRVGFSVDALSRDRVSVALEGFILWSISPDDDGPFRAFRKLGVVDLGSKHPELRSERHVLSTPQHRAFQRLLAADVQRLSASLTLDELLNQGTLLVRLREQLSALEATLGVRVDQVEMLRIRPSDESLLKAMSAATDERLREQAAGVRIEAAERVQRLESESSARLDSESADVRRAELRRDKALRLAKIAHDRQVNEHEAEAAREHALAEAQREQLALDARLERIRREAEAERDAMQAVNTAEESKSQAVREFELSRLATERISDAVKQLPLTDARWVTVGGDSPVASIAGLVNAVREAG